MNTDYTVGQWVQTLKEWPGVPKFTEGMIIENYDGGVVVAWDRSGDKIPADMTPEQIAKLPASRAPLRDGFAADEMPYLVLIEGRHYYKGATYSLPKRFDTWTAYYLHARQQFRERPDIASELKYLNTPLTWSGELPMKADVVRLQRSDLPIIGARAADELIKLADLDGDTSTRDRLIEAVHNGFKPPHLYAVRSWVFGILGLIDPVYAKIRDARWYEIKKNESPNKNSSND